MFFITYSNLWSFSVFLPLTYAVFIFSALFYTLPTLKNQTSYTTTKTKSLFLKIDFSDIVFVTCTPLLVILLTLFLWGSPSSSIWFSHILCTNHTLKMSYWLIFIFSLVNFVLLSTSYLTSREIYDYFIVLYNFLYWILMLFASNTIFTAIFVIEVISAVIFLLIVTSTYSTNYFYRNTSFAFGNLFQNSTPFTFLQSLIYYFWISLISALNLFLFILLMYIKVHTLDWFTLEHVFIYLTSVTSLKDLISFGAVWLILLLSIFIKSGIAPLYLYKPTFFKGLPFYTLFFYICFFYFFFFLFVIHMLNSYFSEIFYFYTSIVTVLIVIGLLVLLFIICDSYYLKIFLAISSILNSLFVLLSLTSAHTAVITFWI